MAHDLARVRADFDQIATFGESGSDRYDRFLLSLILQRPGAFSKWAAVSGGCARRWRVTTGR